MNRKSLRLRPDLVWSIIRFMKKMILLALAALPPAVSPFAANQILIVPDEFPAMEYLAARLQSEENISSQLAWQTNLPPELQTGSRMRPWYGSVISVQAGDTVRSTLWPKSHDAQRGQG